jgi:hypothetical protein
MKKISVYSLFFALLVLNPLHIKAETHKALLSELLSNRVVQIYSAIALGIVGLNCIFDCHSKLLEARDKLNFANKTFDARQIMKRKYHEATFKSQALANAEKAYNYAKIYGFLAGASFLGAGYLTYKVTKS